MKSTLTIAVTGGIGSGKSLVCRVLRCLGHPVFDCDSEAKALMDSDEEIKRRLSSEIAAEVIVDGCIDRRRLADIVFADASRLAVLNEIVHEGVRRRIVQWRDSLDGSLAFVETAIFFQSGLNRMVDAEWRVTAPLETRIRRVMKRNGISRRQVLDRIASQEFEPAPDEPRPSLTEIVNDDFTPVLPQIRPLLGLF